MNFKLQLRSNFIGLCILGEDHYIYKVALFVSTCTSFVVFHLISSMQELKGSIQC